VLINVNSRVFIANAACPLLNGEEERGPKGLSGHGCRYLAVMDSEAAETASDAGKGCRKSLARDDLRRDLPCQ